MYIGLLRRFPALKPDKTGDSRTGSCCFSGCWSSGCVSKVEDEDREGEFRFRLNADKGEWSDEQEA